VITGDRYGDGCEEIRKAGHNDCYGPNGADLKRGPSVTVLYAKAMITR
jgi:hypothetical protein